MERGLRYGSGTHVCNRRKKITWRGVALLLVVFCLPASAGLIGGCGEEKRENKGPEAIPVEVAPVKVAPYQQTLTAVGSLSSPQVTTVSFQTAGRIVFLDINQGDQVEEGKVLARLDDGVQKAEVDAAKATLADARQTYERDKKVVGIGAISKQQLASDKAAVQKAEAQLEEAQVNLDHTVVRAPFTGMLGMRQVSLGAYVKEGEAIVQIQQLDPLYLDFYLPQQDIGQVQTEQHVLFTVAGFPGEFSGKVTTINPALASASRQILIQATVPNPDRKLKPGMFAHVKLVTGTVPDALFIPMQAVVPEGQVRYVWIVGPDDRAEKRKVEVGVYEDNLVRITSGLKPSDRVVTAGTQKIHPNAKVVTQPYQPIHNPRLDLTKPGE